MGAIRRVLVAVAAALSLAMLSGGPAAGDEPGESDEARGLVLQAIALIVHEPGDAHAVEERIEHALEARHQEGVDLNVVKQAAAAVEERDLRRTRELLQTSIGAGPFVGHGVPLPVREAAGEPGRPVFAVGAETGTTVVLDTYRPDPGLGGGDVALLILSVAGIAVGALLAWRSRPRETVRQLRRAAASRRRT